MRRFVVVVLISVLLVSACGDSGSETEETVASDGVPDRVLFLGDSFSQSLSWFEDLAASGSLPFDVTSAVIWESGAPLSQHWSKDGTLEIISGGNWDVVVLQEDLVQHWANVEQFRESAGLLDEFIKTNGAETVLFMHWPWSTSPVPSQEQIKEVVEATSVDLGATVAPVGLAWQQAQAERPGLTLYGTDGIHASAHGEYLTMCVFYATVFGDSPEGLTFLSPQVSEEDGAFLQRIAWETVGGSAQQ